MKIELNAPRIMRTEPRPDLDRDVWRLELDEFLATMMLGEKGRTSFNGTSYRSGAFILLSRDGGSVVVRGLEGWCPLTGDVITPAAWTEKV